MKKKIILILSMCALFVCLFIMSASATNVLYTYDDGVRTDSPYSETYVVYYEDSTNNENLLFSVYGDYAYHVVLYNIEGFQSTFSGMSYQEFFDYNSEKYSEFGHGQYGTDLTSALFNETVYTYFMSWTPSSNITEEDLQAEYTKGYDVGYNAYKESIEYESELETQYKLGSSTGVKNYLASDEYSNALKAEYDNGYEAATSESNQKEAKNMLATALSISGALIVVLLCVYFFIGRKGKKRR